MRWYSKAITLVFKDNNTAINRLQEKFTVKKQTKQKNLSSRPSRPFSLPEWARDKHFHNHAQVSRYLRTFGGIDFKLLVSSWCCWSLGQFASQKKPCRRTPSSPFLGKWVVASPRNGRMPCDFSQDWTEDNATLAVISNYPSGFLRHTGKQVDVKVIVMALCADHNGKYQCGIYRRIQRGWTSCPQLTPLTPWDPPKN